MSLKAEEEEISRPMKRIKRSSIDFLSQLPDDLLLRILSYLPANEAVRSSSLSHRWSHLSSLLPIRPHLRLGNPLFAENYSILPAPFDLEAIERGLTSETIMLTACEIIPDEKPEAGDIESWSYALARRGVRELMIDFARFNGFDGPDTLSFVVQCRSLDKLYLRSCSLLQGSPVGCVFLTSLSLVVVELSDEMILGFASGCKSLTSLEVIKCYGFQELRLEDAKRLKKLSFECSPDSQVEKIAIVGQNLEVLELRAMAMWREMDIVAPRLRLVRISLLRVRRRYFPKTVQGLWKLINGAPDMSRLQLHGATVDCLSCLSPCNLSPSFHDLKQLNINLVLKSAPQARCLAILLQHFTMLEKLNLLIVRGEVLRAAATPPEAEFEKDAWRLKRSPCISNRLQHVTISGFMGRLYEIELSKFFLSRAKALKKMNINLSTLCTDEGKMNADSLSHLVRASPVAKLIIKRAR